MIIAEFIALMIAAAPVHSDVSPKAAARAYKAVVGRDEPPAVRDLAKPAVFIRDGSAKAIVGESGTGWIV